MERPAGIQPPIGGTSFRYNRITVPLLVTDRRANEEVGIGRVGVGLCGLGRFEQVLSHYSRSFT